MHRTVWLARASVVSLVLSSCSSEAVNPPPKPPVGSLEAVVVPRPGPDTVTVKERALPDLYVQALSSRAADGGAQFAELAPLMNPDLAGFSSPGMAPVHEPAAIVAAHDHLFGAFDDRKMALTRVWRTPSEQTLEWVFTGTQAREWMGVPPAHKAVAFRGVTLLWTKDDGSITDVHVYFDVAAVKAQLGVGPKELTSLTATPATPSGKMEAFDQSLPISPAEARNVEVVKAALDALENNNEAGYVGSVSDDVEVDTVERATHGKAEMRTYYRTMHRAIGQLDTTVIGAWGVGPYAVVEYSIAGEQLGPIGWIPAQRDRVVRFELVDICEIHDGKITRVWRYDNPIEIAD